MTTEEESLLWYANGLRLKAPAATDKEPLLLPNQPAAPPAATYNTSGRRPGLWLLLTQYRPAVPFAVLEVSLTAVPLLTAVLPPETYRSTTTAAAALACSS